MLKLIKSFLPVGRMWWALGGTFLIASSLGGWLGASLQSIETNKVRAEYADYRTQVVKSVSEENAQVSLALQDLYKNLNTFQKELKEQQSKDQTLSDNLIKELQNANGKSCPLSPAIEHYLDSLRNRTFSPG